MSGSKGQVSRRRFLEMVGIAGGASAVYESMVALGMIRTPHAWAGPMELEPGSGKGKTVLILGAGIGGLTTAYLLDQAGYRCEILEALPRAGGRSLTARPGTRIHQAGHQDQICNFDRGLYLNMGPGRLPYHHRRVLHFCEQLQVPLEPYVMNTTANLYQTPQAFDGQAMGYRRVANDTRGYVAELLAKAVDKGALDDELQVAEAAEMKDQLLCMLKIFGDLGQNDACRKAKENGPCLACAAGCDDCEQSCATCGECVSQTPECFTYSGSTRSGCAHPPAVDQACDPTAPIPLADLLDSQFWRHRFYQPVDFEWQPTLFQPVGGMDEIVRGFQRQIGHLVEYQSVVRDVQVREDGVSVTYQDHLTGDVLTKNADYCVSNIPLPLWAKIGNNFAGDFASAVQQATFADAAKVGWQAEQRFWENDANQIYGGISFIDDLITQIWYPSEGYFTGKGTLTGAYIYDDAATKFGELGLGGRLDRARQGAARLHGQFADRRIVPQDKGLSIVWKQVPHQAGGWADWDDSSDQDRDAYNRLLLPYKGRFFVVGDQESTLPGWQEGAMMSAEHVVELIHEIKAHADVEPLERAPSSRRLVQGRF